MSGSGFNSDIFWHKNLGNGTFAAKQLLISPGIDRNFIRQQYFNIADINGDQWTDILVASEIEVSWHQNLGNAVFLQHVIASGSGVRPIVLAADFNSDGCVVRNISYCASLKNADSPNHVFFSISWREGGKLKGGVSMYNK